MKEITKALQKTKKRVKKITGRPVRRTYRCGICGQSTHNRRTHDHAKME